MGASFKGLSTVNLCKGCSKNKINKNFLKINTLTKWEKGDSNPVIISSRREGDKVCSANVLTFRQCYYLF